MDGYRDRRQAGEMLAKQLLQFANNKEVIVLAIPRGGVPVAYEIAKTLNVPLDIFIVRKLGHIHYPELAMGAITRDRLTVFNQDVLAIHPVLQTQIDEVIAAEYKELQRREMVYRHGNSFPNLKGKTIILVDDGVATGATLRVAILSLKRHFPEKIIVAVPVIAEEVFTLFSTLVDEVISPLIVKNLSSVGLWYEDFPQTSDGEVIFLLDDLEKK